MTSLAIGSSVTLSVGDGGAVSVATNGGFGSVVVTPTVGSATTENFGPFPHRKVYGPASEGASVVVANSSCTALDYDYQRGGSMDPALQALVSQAGNPQNTMVALGDSITARANVVSGSNRISQATSFLAWAAAKLGGNLRIANAGVSGDTTAQMLARYATDVTPVAGKWLHVLGGGNDVTSITTAAQIAATISNLASILALARAEARNVVLGTIYPFTGQTTNIQRAAIAQINRWVRQQACESVRVADYYGAMVDQSGVIRTGYLVSDNIHPSPLGACSGLGITLVGALASALSPRGHILSSSLWDADNLCRFGQMVGNNASGASGWTASGGVTGNGPSYWTASSTGAIAATASKQARTPSSPVADFARIAIGTSGVDDSYVRLEYSANMRLWAASATANGIRRFYVPTTGCQYDVLVAGQLAATDQTATWPTDIGAIFTDNTATLMCVPPIVVGSVLRLAVECNISGVSVGQVLPEAQVFVRNTASANQAVGTSLQNQLVGVDGSAPNAADVTGGLVLETPDIIVPAGWDLANTTTSAGPSLYVRLNLYVRNSALGTVDWGRATVRVA